MVAWLFGHHYSISTRGGNTNTYQIRSSLDWRNTVGCIVGVVVGWRGALVGEVVGKGVDTFGGSAQRSAATSDALV